ncbi:PQQ-dependent sugar dehydrogenase [Granulicella mallensis]|uniref:NHL repeat-containing protein n=1 Tax=Granulicella mallensis (strain ATCC BAA-1857 / DSM 23137 / MP5ACTX8) TaxID=682795 RepID=G8NRZ6_GRAMM|nr:PQQ-dependent sugar dehydrogenase [Granulicella mallensis]AEU35109.1 NHL repeat-containing protein [Granulicella mallensis MP5ACTX8]
MRKRFLSLLATAAAATLMSANAVAQQPLLTGQAAFTDYNQQAPGVRHKITVGDLPEPHPDESVNNTPRVIAKPANAWPVAPAGFKVTLYAGGDATPMQRADNKEHMTLSGGTFTEPRVIRTAPNGDLFVADSGAGVLLVLRGIGPDGKAARIEKFATGLDHPFGIAFYPAKNPKYLYVGNATTVQRFAYKTGDLHASGAAETIVPDIPGYAQLTGGGHWTRDVIFSADGQHLLVSVGSGSNVDDPDTHPKEFHRADVLEYTPEGKFIKIYAYGIRNCVGEAINPITGQLWCSVNERDNLGNHLVPDYVTSVKEDGFYGWPWFYMGGHQDPRHAGKHPELQSKVITPDVLVQPHMASLEMTFYPTAKKADAFPAEYGGYAFAAEHGSWNRLNRAGYEVVSIPMKNGHATGEYDDFLTGFVTADGQVWGRPVGVTVGNDGSLFVTDDGSRSVWHVVYTGK